MIQNMSIIFRRICNRPSLLCATSRLNNFIGHGESISRVQPCRHFSLTETFVNLNNSIATSAAVSGTKVQLFELHEWLHLPWFAEIALVTIGVRFLITLPLMIGQRRILYRYEALKPEIMNLTNLLRPKVKEYAYLHNLNQKQMQMLYSKTVKLILLVDSQILIKVFHTAYKGSQSTDCSR